MVAAVGSTSTPGSKCLTRLAQVIKCCLRWKVLWVNDQSDKNFVWSFESLDAMLAGQDLGLNVANGYSGLFPKGYPSAMSAE